MGKARRGGVVASAVVAAGRQLRSEGVVSLARVVEVLGEKHVVWVPEVVEGRQAVRDGRAHAQARMRVTWRSTVDGSELTSVMVGEAWADEGVEGVPLAAVAQDTALAQVAARVLGVEVEPSRWELSAGPGPDGSESARPGMQLARIDALNRLAAALVALASNPLATAEIMAERRGWGDTVSEDELRLALDEVERRESARLREVTDRTDPARTAGGAA